MANANTIAGFYNLPQYANPGTTAEFPYLVPAQGIYPGLPSPILAAAAGLVIPVDAGDVVGTATTSPAPLDGRSFILRVAGKYNSHTSQNLTVKFYEVPATIVAAGTQATLTNDHAIMTTSTLAAGSGANNLDVFGIFCWDSASKVLNGILPSTARVASAVPASGQSAGQSAVTSVNQQDLNFLVSFTWSSGTSADLIGPLDFTVERV